MKKFVMVLPLICAACSEPEPIFSSSKSITFNNVTSSKLSEITTEAQKHCARVGLNADLAHFNQQLGVAEFRCLSG